MKTKLADVIKKYEITNVLLKSPMPRYELIQEYLDSDILFLHLNTMTSLQRSLPSKLFEYAVIGKPIVGGLSGYSKNFLLSNIPHGRTFQPGNVQECVDCLKNSAEIQVEKQHITIFVDKFSREKIMYSLAKEVLRHVKSQLH